MDIYYRGTFFFLCRICHSKWSQNYDYQRMSIDKKKFDFKNIFCDLVLLLWMNYIYATMIGKRKNRHFNVGPRVFYNQRNSARMMMITDSGNQTCSVTGNHFAGRIAKLKGGKIWFQNSAGKGYGAEGAPWPWWAAAIS